MLILFFALVAILLGILYFELRVATSKLPKDVLCYMILNKKNLWERCFCYSATKNVPRFIPKR